MWNRYFLLVASCVAITACGQNVTSTDGVGLGSTDPVLRQNESSDKFTLSNDELSQVSEALLAEGRLERPRAAMEGSFKAASVDLNEDGARELVVWMESRDHCGSGGCTLRVYRAQGGKLAELSRTTIARLPIEVFEYDGDDWLSLIVGVGGGGLKSGRALLRFDGKTYPRNPTVPPAQRTNRIGTTVLDMDSQAYPLAN